MLGRLKHRLLTLFEDLCTLNTVTDTGFKNPWTLGNQVPVGSKIRSKKPCESENAPLYPQSSSFNLQEGGRINFFVYFVQDCACVVVNPCVSRSTFGQVIPDTVQITYSRMGTCTQNRILHHEGCPARSLNPWKKRDTN